MNIIRKVYVTKELRYEPIKTVYGNKIPIELEVMDYDISGTTANVYSEFLETGKVFQNSAPATISGNRIVFTPDTGLFMPGHNKLQVQLVGVRTFAIDVKCHKALDQSGEVPENPNEVLGALDRALVAADQATVAAKKAVDAAEGVASLTEIGVDTTLTVTGAAADAAFTGRRIDAVKDDFSYTNYKTNGIDSVEELTGKYCTYNSSGVTIANVAGCGVIKIKVSGAIGRKLTISAKEKDTVYNILYVVSDADNKVLKALATSGATNYNNVELIIPENSAYLYINFVYVNGTKSAFFKVQNDSEIRVNAIAQEVGNLSVAIYANFDVLSDTSGKYCTFSSAGAVAIASVAGCALMKVDVSAIVGRTVAISAIEKDATYNIAYVVADASDNALQAFKTDGVTEYKNALGIISAGAKYMYVNHTSGSKVSIRVIENEITDKFSGKEVWCYGDSLTWYDGHNASWGPHKGEKIKGYQSYLRETLNTKIVNCGRSGETIPQICDRLATDGNSNADVLILMGGDNDDRQGVNVGTLLPYGSTFDRRTTTGAMQFAIETFIKRNPTAMVFLMTEPIGWKYNGTALERVEDVYPNAIRRVAEHYGLPFLDLWKISGVNEMTRNTMYLDPPDTENNMYMYHPSNYGWSVIAPRIVQFMKMLK